MLRDREHSSASSMHHSVHQLGVRSRYCLRDVDPHFRADYIAPCLLRVGLVQQSLVPLRMAVMQQVQGMSAPCPSQTSLSQAASAGIVLDSKLCMGPPFKNCRIPCCNNGAVLINGLCLYDE